MILLRSVCFSMVLMAGLRNATSQSFINLGFETTTITAVSFPGGTRYTATIPGWSWNTFNPVNGDPNSIALNDVALSAPAVTLHAVDSPFFPAIRGSYSILLQGGSIPGGADGASIFQTGQVPFTSQSLIYSGGVSLQVFFNGQMLTPIALSDTPDYTVWGVSILAYAGQSGELRFTAPPGSTPFLSGAILDDIRFSPTPVPEPSVTALCGVLILCLLAIRGRRGKGMQITRIGRGRVRAASRRVLATA